MELLHMSWVYFQALCSIPLVYSSIPVPVPNYPNYYGFRIYPDI